MSIVFEAKTNEAHAVKILVEALNYYLNKKGAFIINKTGIFLRNIDKNETVLCDMSLHASVFQLTFIHSMEIC